MIWSSKTIHIDIDTGEIISKKNANRYYYKIKTTKKTVYNEHKTIGHLEYTNLYRVKNQLEIDFERNNK